MGYFDYEYESAAEEISDFMSGRTQPFERKEAFLPHAIAKARCYVNNDIVLTSRHGQIARLRFHYIPPQVYRTYLIAKGAIRPNAGRGELLMDDKARNEAARECLDFDDYGAYADRGITIANGKPESVFGPTPERRAN